MTAPSLPPVLALDELVRGLPEGAARAVVVGWNWTLVEAAEGCGLSATPARGRGGARTTPETGSYAGRTLRALASLARSANPYERAIGCAAVNAGLARYDLAAPGGNGLDPPDGAPEGRTVAVGRFPGLDARLPGATVLERDPGPGDLPADAAPEAVPGCARLVVTASAWANGSLAGLLALAGGAHTTLVGPGTPLAPAVFFPRGIDRLAGFVATDPAGLRRAVAEGAGARALRRFGRDAVLEAGRGG